MSTATQWIDLLLLVARSEGEVTVEDEAAIRRFSETLATRKFDIMAAASVYLEYRAWKRRHEGGGGGAAEPADPAAVQAALLALDSRVDALEAWRAIVSVPPGPGPAPPPFPVPPSEPPPTPPVPPPPTPPPAAGQVVIDGAHPSHVVTAPAADTHRLSFRIVGTPALDTQNPERIHNLASIMPTEGFPFSAIAVLLNKGGRYYAITGSGAQGAFVSRIRNATGQEVTAMPVGALAGATVTLEASLAARTASARIVGSDGSTWFERSTPLSDGVVEALRAGGNLLGIGHARSVLAGELDVPWGRLVVEVLEAR